MTMVLLYILSVLQFVLILWLIYMVIKNKEKIVEIQELIKEAEDLDEESIVQFPPYDRD